MINLIYPSKVQIEDTDMFGVVYHPNYFKFYERARSHWFEDIGFSFDNEEGVLFVIRHAQIDYLKPLRLRQKFEVVTKVASLSKASVIFSQAIRLVDDRECLVNKAMIKVTCINKQYKPNPLPEWLVKELSSAIE